MADIYCYAEPGSFSDHEFRRDERGLLMVPHIHETNIPHYVTGEPLNAGGDDGTLGSPGLPMTVCEEQ